jgi:thioredoxin-related protein
MSLMSGTPLAKRSFLAAAAVAVSLLLPAFAQASELVMFEQGGCVFCARWNRDVAPVYDKTAEARLLPLRRVDIGQQNAAGVTLTEPVRYTPTFVVVDNGHEIGRITGYISDESFWGLLDTLAAKLAAPPQPKI